jgi:hypothetical protein
MAVYPVFIPKQNTMYVDGTKKSINAKMKSLGITNYKIGKIVPKSKLGLIKNIIKPGSIKKPAPFGAGFGKTAGGPNAPGMKPDFEAQSKRADVIKKKKEEEKKKKEKTSSNKRVSRGIGTKTNTTSSGKGKGPVLTADKKNSIIQRVQNKNPKIPKSRILSWIAKNPVKSAAIGASALSAAILAALSVALSPSKIADTTLPKKSKKLKRDFKAPVVKGSSKDKKSSNISVIIATPVPKPKINNNNKSKKKKAQNGSKSQTFNLIVGGKGTAKTRLAEIDAEKKLEKRLGRRPTKKELVNYMGKRI